MSNPTKLLIIAVGLALFLGPAIISAQDITEAVNLDENIQASDLGIGEPTILPDNPLYFLKNWGRGIQSFFTFNPIAKAELKEKFANEKLLELKKTIEQKKNQEVIKKAAENYQQGVERVKEQVKKIKEKAKENPKVDSFLNKFIHQQTLHQKLLQKLETQVPPEALGKIKEAREAHLERFHDVMLKLEDRAEVITEKLDKILEEQKGSGFKEFKNLEVLKNLEEKVPEQAKEAIQRAQENALKRLHGNLEKMSSEGQEKFNNYVEKISGAKEKHLEIIENLKLTQTITPGMSGIELKEKLGEGAVKLLERMEKKLEKEGKSENIDVRSRCPQWAAPGPNFCLNGRIIVEKDSAGCFSPPKCIIPGDIVCESSITCEVGYESYNTGERNNQGCPIKKCIKAGTDIIPPATGIIPPSTGVGRACIEIWKPVCGKNGKTYSNECFAKAAGMEIEDKGICKESKCPEIKCVRDPCPGEHLPNSTGCINCASPCNVPSLPNETPSLPNKPTQPGFCIQVIAPAISPEGICKEFPTPCDVPAGWKKVQKCPEVPSVGVPPATEPLTENGCCTPCDRVCNLESVVGCKRAVENGICEGWKVPCPCP
ncbi:hypothetical protein KKG29_04340 [Patescibacteria group bacterium]|nr:hypothetical protein [Patescibacteria group bacterium]MBU4000370.1 hypothetical protein [Patescibacteria group bacterium]MBU4056453.1 hypothetical protein [Patescibacteria group bacterium]MBU4368839.1 hypothetical protein [Patescibacteria group bacterium]